MATDYAERARQRARDQVGEKAVRSVNGQANTSRPTRQDTHEPGLVTTCLATLRPQPVRWLVPDYIPLGKLVMVAGDGGHGKSTLTLDLTACLTTGRPAFGLDYEPLPPSDVLLISCEDDFEDTVVPRLLSAGADLNRVHRVDGIRSKDGKALPFDMRHYEAMRNDLKAHTEVRLVVIDPAGAYIGRAGVDENKDAELRSLLGPMSELAAEALATIQLVKHLIKGATAKAVHKVGGSAGYVNAVRAAYIVAPDADDPDKKLFLPLKFNLGPRPSGLAYRMKALPDVALDTVINAYGNHLDQADRDRLRAQLFRIYWEGRVDVTADSVLADQSRLQAGPNKVDMAAEWLEKFLSVHAYPHDEVIQAGEAAGHTKNNLFRARKNLAPRVNASNKGRFGGNWHWGPGDPRDWVMRPTIATADNDENADNGEIPSENPRVLSIVTNVSNVSSAVSGNGDCSADGDRL